jgi:hypothetical protein
MAIPTQSRKALFPRMLEYFMRLRLSNSYLGAITTGLFFAAAINGLIRAAEPPLSRLLVLLINRVVQKGVPDFLPVHVPAFEWDLPLLNAAEALIVAMIAILFAGWLYPERFDCQNSR